MNLRLLAAFAASLLTAGCATLPATTPPVAQAYPAGMVSAADPRAAEAGAAMLRQGGSATDAALATMLALTVVEPQSSGIGGGGFYVASNAEGKVETIDGRETAPAAAHPKWFSKDGVQLRWNDVVPGGTSAGVPGNIALAAKAHAAHGRLPWAKLFEPAIKHARDGFVVTPRLSRDDARRRCGDRLHRRRAPALLRHRWQTASCRHRDPQPCACGNARGGRRARGRGVLPGRQCSRNRRQGHHCAAQSRADGGKRRHFLSSQGA